jgi:hypothetical protein
MDIKLTNSHDLSVENFDLVLVDGRERVRQQVLIKLKLWRGEWFLDTEFGTPWLQSILGKQVSLSGVLSAIQASVLAVRDVRRFLEFTYNFDRRQRTLTVDFTIDTNFGPVQVST